jgi:hypothetical protein
MLAAVEVRGCENVVLEDLVVGVARAGGHWRRGHCDDGRGDFCESCACEEDEREARWEEMHREAGDVYKVLLSVYFDGLMNENAVWINAVLILRFLRTV